MNFSESYERNYLGEFVSVDHFLIKKREQVKRELEISFKEGHLTDGFHNLSKTSWDFFTDKYLPTADSKKTRDFFDWLYYNESNGINKHWRRVDMERDAKSIFAYVSILHKSSLVRFYSANRGRDFEFWIDKYLIEMKIEDRKEIFKELLTNP